jgi:hypothetical protein
MAVSQAAPNLNSSQQHKMCIYCVEAKQIVVAVAVGDEGGMR